jgi:hypothetical protein
MNTLTRKTFTLVEIALALMVASVGIIGIMALFPVGLAKNKETISTRSAADAGDQFLHTMAAEVRADWEVTDAFPDIMPTMAEDTIVWSNGTVLENSNATFNFSALNVSDDFDPLVNQDGLFKVTQTTPGNVVDFTGVIRSWKELVEIGDPRLNGDVMPFGLVDASGGTDDVGFGFMNSEEYTLKHNSNGGVTAGNFGALNFSGQQGGGASLYEQFIISGGNSVQVGETYSPETGNMVGKTISGMQSRLDPTPYIRVPVVTSFPNGASQEVAIIGFLPFKLVAVSGTGNTAAIIKAVYIGSDIDGNASSTSSYKLTLKAEVSWPYELPYASRQTETFSLTLFKGGYVYSVDDAL